MRRLSLLLLLLIAPLAAGQKPQTTTLKVYFASEKLDPNAEDCSKVYAVTRTIPKTAAVARAALEQLFGGPSETEKARGFVSWFSDETKSILRGVKVKNRTAYVNFNDLSGFPILGNATTSCGSAQFFAQVEKTLKQFPTIKHVFFAIEGDPQRFYEWMQMECPEELKNCDKTNFN